MTQTPLLQQKHGLKLVNAPMSRPKTKLELANHNFESAAIKQLKTHELQTSSHNSRFLSQLTTNYLNNVKSGKTVTQRRNKLKKKISRVDSESSSSPRVPETTQGKASRKVTSGTSSSIKSPKIRLLKT